MGVFTGGSLPLTERSCLLMSNSMDDKLAFENEKIIPDIKKNIARIKEICDSTSDLLVNEIEASGIKIALLCCEGMFSTSTITELVLLPLTKIDIGKTDGKRLYNHMMDRMLMSADRVEADNYAQLFRAMNSGFAVVIIDGVGKALAFGVQGYSVRGISEPSGEQNVTGSHEGFVEVVRTNMSLIRRRMKTPYLKLELFVMGDKSQTDLCLCYMRDRVPEKLISDIKKSLKKSSLETILSTGYIQPFLQRPRMRFFDSTGTTERPDVLCSKLLEGRVALLVDGTPFAIVIPKLFTESFQTIDDYNCKPYYAAFIRWIKYTAFILAVLSPAVYIAIAVHHPELLNRTLLLILADSEKNAPFSLITEAFGVLIMYEVIREAGLRLPKVAGGAVSIVGGLIIGDAAVESGFISTPVLTVVALAVTSGFVIPDLNQPVTVLRFLFLICGGLGGLYGISLLGAAVLFNICATEDYGFPYTAPVSPFTFRAMRDIVTRVGFRKMQHGNFTVEQLNRKQVYMPHDK